MILTSVLKNIDVSVFNTINNVLVLGSVGNTFNGTLANGGVGLAALQDNADRVSAELLAQVDAIAAGIASLGSIQAYLDSVAPADG